MRFTFVLASILGLLACCGPGPADSLAAEGTTPLQSASSPEGCPPTWSAARALCTQRAACTSPRLYCVYPRAGDQLSDGTFADAVFGCGAQQVFVCAQ
ncbi:MAG: hypothetical protein U0228_31475 [Myxococcaceae bacterium]